jgi:hypothetical protein
MLVKYHYSLDKKIINDSSNRFNINYSWTSNEVIGLRGIPEWISYRMSGIKYGT